MNIYLVGSVWNWAEEIIGPQTTQFTDVIMTVRLGSCYVFYIVYLSTRHLCLRDTVIITDVYSTLSTSTHIRNHIFRTPHFNLMYCTMDNSFIISTVISLLVVIWVYEINWILYICTYARTHIHSFLIFSLFVAAYTVITYTYLSEFLIFET